MKQKYDNFCSLEPDERFRLCGLAYDDLKPTKAVSKYGITVDLVMPLKLYNLEDFSSPSLNCTIFESVECQTVFYITPDISDDHAMYTANLQEVPTTRGFKTKTLQLTRHLTQVSPSCSYEGEFRDYGFLSSIVDAFQGILS